MAARGRSRSTAARRPAAARRRRPHAARSASSAPTGDGGVAGQPIFNLTTKTGYISLPDGNTAYMWGYSSGFDGFQHPGPVLCVNEGDTVTVILHNTLPGPGLDHLPRPGGRARRRRRRAAGVRRRRQRAPRCTDTAAAAGGTVTYSFVADHPGTFLYESGTDPEKQVRMGLFGALIVRPADGAGAERYAYDTRRTASFTPDRGVHGAALGDRPLPAPGGRARASTFNINNYHPRYWLINGRGFPDSIADNGASWLPTQPYGALAQIHEFDDTGHPCRRWRATSTSAPRTTRSTRTATTAW